MSTKRKYPDLPTGIRLDPDMKRWLVQYAAGHDLTVSQVVRRAVQDYRAKIAGGAA